MFAAGKAASGAEPTDAQFNYVTMLLHGNGTNGAQNNTFLDSSTNNFTITRNGNTTQGTFTPYGSNWSNYFTGANSLSFATNAAFSLNSSAFTIEAWVCLNSASGDRAVTSTYGGSTTGWSLQFQSGILNFYRAGDTIGITATTTISAGVWYHIAVSGTAGTSMKMFINGVQQGSTSTGNITDSSTALSVGQLANVNYLAGYVSNLRLVKGTALYTANFTPPTSPLTAITNTSLLTCQSNRFIDSSANAFTCSLNGSPSVQRFSPFSPTTAYSTSVIGGSAYFDGNGDYLTTPSNAAFNLSTGDWTIELWVYLTASYDSYYGGHLIGSAEPNTGTGGWSLVLRSGSIVVLGGGNSQGIYAVNFQLNTWNHIAFVRSGTGANSASLYFNGVPYTATGNGAGNPTFNSTNGPVYIGEHPSYTVTAITGYISNARVVKGTAVYAINQSSITVPTTPLTAITNTSLLLSTTNAGILDNAMMNDLETVGNAQISTSVKKYGTGSMAFDGTDDRLTSASSPNIAFGTGDFTVEAWIYTNTLSGERGFLQTSDTAGGLKTSYTTGILFAIGVSPYSLNVNVGNTNVSSGTTYLAINTWYHIAVTRASGSVRLFINGILVGGPTTITTDLTGQNICVGGYYNTSYLWNGYIDDLRITKGVARYTANFTAPTAAFPDKG